MESLWPDFKEISIEKNETINILREQAKAIKTATGNKICGTFSKMSYKTVPADSVGILGEMITSLSLPCREELLEAELVNKKDANALYNKDKYKFEIFNEEYRFRLFVVNYCELFPITLEVDNGILNEIKYSNNIVINTNDELKHIIREIFSCKKVNTIISKMIQGS